MTALSSSAGGQEVEHTPEKELSKTGKTGSLLLKGTVITSLTALLVHTGIPDGKTKFQQLAYAGDNLGGMIVEKNNLNETEGYLIKRGMGNEFAKSVADLSREFQDATDNNPSKKQYLVRLEDIKPIKDKNGLNQIVNQGGLLPEDAQSIGNVSRSNAEETLYLLYDPKNLKEWLRDTIQTKDSYQIIEMTDVQIKEYAAKKSVERDNWIAKVKETKPEVADEWYSIFNNLKKHLIIPSTELERRLFTTVGTMISYKYGSETFKKTAAPLLASQLLDLVLMTNPELSDGGVKLTLWSEKGSLKYGVPSYNQLKETFEKFGIIGFDELYSIGDKSIEGLMKKGKSSVKQVKLISRHDEAIRGKDEAIRGKEYAKHVKELSKNSTDLSVELEKLIKKYIDNNKDDDLRKTIIRKIAELEDLLKEIDKYPNENDLTGARMNINITLHWIETFRNT